MKVTIKGRCETSDKVVITLKAKSQGAAQTEADKAAEKLLENGWCLGAGVKDVLTIDGKYRAVIAVVCRFGHSHIGAADLPDATAQALIDQGLAVAAK